jgi:hypothetical protein
MRTATISRRALAGLFAVGVALSVPGAAHAQLIGSGTGTGTTSGYGVTINPTVPRFYPNGVTTYNYRAANLNPNDVNYQDCEDNIILQFNVLESGIGATDAPDILQIWAGTTDCTQTTARSGGVSPFCWQVAAAQAPTQTATVNIFARSLTRYIDTALSTVPNDGNPVIGANQPESACHTQTSSGQVATSIYFMFLPNAGDATPDASTSYALNIDLVGPLNPTNLNVGIGDTLLIPGWTAQVDPTIVGFRVYAQDQGPGGLGLFAEAGSAVQTTPVYCRASSGTQVCADAGNASIDGAITDATLSIADAQCTTVFPDGSAYTEVPDASGYADLSDASLASMGCKRGGENNSVTTAQLGGGSCTSSVLVNKFSSSVTETATSLDGGSTIIDGAVISTGVTTTTVDGALIGATVGVGISQIDSKYQVADVGNTTTSEPILSALLPDGGTGPLINGHQYAIAVAAYDDDGNVGLVSNLFCQTPEPVIDFWDRYEADGGKAGGGFCALEGPGIPVAGSVFGMGVGAAALVFARRRRRRNS